MKNIQLTLPDGSTREAQQGSTGLDMATDIGPGLAKAAIAVKINGEIKDLSTPIQNSAKFSILTSKDKEALEIMRHSCAHLMAMAVKELWPDALLAIGPTIDNGFYYDIDCEHSFSPEDFSKIQKQMKKLVKQKIPVQRFEIAREEAKVQWDSEGEIYKVDLLNEIEDETVSYYKQGEFFDLCRGPHVPHTGHIGHFKILSCAGAYWRGNEKNKMLQRLYATAFFSKQELKDHLFALEEAKKRDHRKLGKQLELFSFHEEGAGFPFWHPKGMRLYNTIMDFCRVMHLKYGYEELKTPIILNEALWKRSGHWDKYQENMYFTEIDGDSHAVKPMNCPGGLLVYKSQPHSYREFPIKNFEFGLVHRHEKAGVLHGLFRVRQFTQDDAHIFCLPEQVETQIGEVFDFILQIYKIFGFEDYKIELSTRPEKYIGEIKTWDKAEAALESVLKSKNIDFQLNPGDGAFYGPKIDFHILDSLKRSWQCGTIQLDFSMPERFELEYTDADGGKKRPVMIHRALLGSFERFIGIMLENCAGDLPLWLNPVHGRVLPISEKFVDYATDVQNQLFKAGLYIEIDARNEKIGKKIREGEQNKIPYLLITGEKEVEAGSVALRKRKTGDLGTFSVDEIIEKFKLESSHKSILD